MKRAIILVMDSFGIGATADADRFGDTGADTFGSIARERAKSADGPLRLPNLARLGLLEASRESTGAYPEGISAGGEIIGAYGFAEELSSGKDTPSGHWEIAGVPVLFDWGYFTDRTDTFPPELIDALVERAGLPGVLGNCHASGTTIIAELGDEHVRTGKPIVYTSADSVLQIAAHEERFGLERLYAVCEIARELVDAYRVGRVIARPFVGSGGTFERTLARRDWTTPPHAPTLLDVLAENGREVIGVGKIHDIFAGRGIGSFRKTSGNDDGIDATIEALREDRGDLVFTNLVDFDSRFGHRNDPSGYASALEDFDARVPELLAALGSEDALILTADHGNDPTTPGTDHTRERVPLLVAGGSVAAGDLGTRQTFADLGATIPPSFWGPAQAWVAESPETSVRPGFWMAPGPVKYSRWLAKVNAALPNQLFESRLISDSSKPWNVRW